MDVRSEIIEISHPHLQSPLTVSPPCPSPFHLDANFCVSRISELLYCIRVHRYRLYSRHHHHHRRVQLELFAWLVSYLATPEIRARVDKSLTRIYALRRPYQARRRVSSVYLQVAAASIGTFHLATGKTSL